VTGLRSQTERDGFHAWSATRIDDFTGDFIDDFIGTADCGDTCPMSPVKQAPTRTPRSIILAVAGVTLGLILVLVLFIFAIPSLTESGKVEVKLGSDTYDAGSAESLARSIASAGPLLLPDVSGGKRDVYLQHLGDDDTTEWHAFDARRPGQSRDCSLNWRADSDDFVDPCDGTVVPSDGSGLLDYRVTVSDSGRVVVDFNPDDAPSETAPAVVD
jgi:hypothetical protein